MKEKKSKTLHFPAENLNFSCISISIYKKNENKSLNAKQKKQPLSSMK